MFPALSQDPNNEFVGDDIRNVSTGDGGFGFDDMDSAMAVLTMDAALGEHTLTAIAGYWEFDYANRLDVDGVPELFLNSNLAEDYDQTSLELRLLSPTGGTFDYLAGASYFKSDTYTRQVSPFGFTPAPVPWGHGQKFSARHRQLVGVRSGHLARQVNACGSGWMLATQKKSRRERVGPSQ